MHNINCVLFVFLFLVVQNVSSTLPSYIIVLGKCFHRTEMQELYIKIALGKLRFKHSRNFVSVISEGAPDTPRCVCFSSSGKPANTITYNASNV